MSAPREGKAGLRRVRTTHPSVKLVERAAQAVISIAGVGTILAVGTICAFLVWVVAPLFEEAELGQRATVPRGASTVPAVRLEVDESRTLAWTLDAEGRIEARKLDTGALLETARPFGDTPPTARAFRGNQGLFGFEDGGLCFGRIGVTSSDAAPGSQRTQRLSVEIEPRLAPSNRTRVLQVDLAESGGSRRFAALHADGSLFVHEVTKKQNLLTGESTFALTEALVQRKPLTDRGAPEHLLLAGGGTSLYLVWSDGLTQRYDTRDLDDIQLAEVVGVLEHGRRVGAVTTLIGETSLVVGDDEGRATVWFPTRPAGASTSDGQVLMRVHDLDGVDSPIRAIEPSARTRTVALAHESGAIEIFSVTSARRLALLEAPTHLGSARIEAIDLAPKDDGLAAVTGDALWNAAFDLRHPEAGLRAIFTPVWYEGYAEPRHVWQSSSGTDDFEPKLGLVPLVFGTLKATFYSLLFGVPLALFAAIYSSEFLHPQLRVPIKSGIEMMASLPSVVLGFLAAIILAPFVQTCVPTVIAAFFTLPLVLLGAAYLWQLLPARLALRWAGWQKLAFIALALPCGVVLAVLAAPSIEARLFGGDFLQWLNGARGSPFGGWLLLLLPLATGLVLLGSQRLLGPRLRASSLDWSRAACARFDLARFLVCALAVLALAGLGAGALSIAGFDPRGTLVDTYVQRNALIVGFVMGFAIVPIIYTLAEDALSSVPGHLRLASLGCGATPWQTALRVIVPTAMSGLFSAVMIGLGRAVGETMIVLMAAGNTPVMDINVFSGFRTLSANIATELPEAVEGSTHYRMLFLAALTLFAITFLINTAAELVRQRFRKRAFQL
ncbi:MAG TPA: ABC transporter permease subunit [Planctomycetota bacterium]|nr:ABC transporter permease subunit [Planctomycetota bacterium]